MSITVFTYNRIPIQLDEKPLATAGGEGTVYRVKSTGALANSCVKIYHPHNRTSARKSKVEFMIQNKPQVVSSVNFIICWPTDLVFDNNGTFIGFVMPLAFSGSEKLYELTNLKINKRLQLYWSKFDRSTTSGIEKRFMVCVNIAISIHSIHQTNNYALVDFNPRNILITSEGKVSIVDVDSFQISKNNSVVFYGPVATPEYAPPESARINPSNTFVPESWDRFSLAVSFYEILFGIHPYAATCDGQYHSVTELGQKIQKGLFVHGSKKNYLTVVPSIHNNFQNLPLPLRQLFIKTFEEGHTNINARPTAEQWGKAIHYELISKTGIKGNPISVPQQINSNPNTTTYRKPLQKSIINKPVTKKKEHYMIWKISTLLLAALLIFFIIKNLSNKTDIKNYKSEAEKLEKVKLVLQNQNLELSTSLNQLRSSSEKEISKLKIELNSIRNQKNSEVTNLKNELDLSNKQNKIKESEMTNVIDKIGMKNPITINSITFNNVENQTVITKGSRNFNINDFKYFQIEINYDSNLRQSGYYDIDIKIYYPNEKLIEYSDAPKGYSDRRKVFVDGNYSKNKIMYIGRWGLNCPNCNIGTYKTEIWYNSILIGETFFRINNY